MKIRADIHCIIIFVATFKICITQNNQEDIPEELHRTSHGSPLDQDPMGDNQRSKTSNTDQTGHKSQPSLEQVTNTLAQLQQQYQALISWQENTNNVFQQRMDSLTMENANVQQGLEGFTQNTHFRLLELERTYAKSFMFTAFTATGSEAKTFRAGSTVEFKNIVTNEGGAYNPESSVFNCQYDGFFHFQFTVYTTNTHPVEVELINAGKPVVSSQVSRTSSNNIMSNSAVVFCEGGDQVMLKVKTDFEQYLEFDGKYSTFSGYAVAAVET